LISKTRKISITYEYPPQESTEIVLINPLESPRLWGTPPSLHPEVSGTSFSVR